MSRWIARMKKLAATGMVALGFGLFSPAAYATTYFQDNFNAENGGAFELNYTDFTQWTVTGGSVDLVGNGTYDVLPGNGLYVDLIGSNHAGPGTLTSMNINLDPGNYQLFFDLAGSNLYKDGNDNTVNVSLGSLFNQSYTLDKFDPFSTHGGNFTVGSNQTVSIVFASAGPDDYIGVLLDNVRLNRLDSYSYGKHGAVPEPMTLGLICVALTAVGMSLRRRRLA